MASDSFLGSLINVLVELLRLVGRGLAFCLYVLMNVVVVTGWMLHLGLSLMGVVLSLPLFFNIKPFTEVMTGMSKPYVDMLSEDDSCTGTMPCTRAVDSWVEFKAKDGFIYLLFIIATPFLIVGSTLCALLPIFDLGLFLPSYLLVNLNPRCRKHFKKLLEEFRDDTTSAAERYLVLRGGTFGLALLTLFDLVEAFLSPRMLMVLQDARDKNLDRGAILAHVFWAIVDLFCLTLGVLVFLTFYRASELWASLRANFNNKETEHRWRKCALVCLAKFLVMDLLLFIAALLELVTLYRTIPFISGLRSALSGFMPAERTQAQLADFNMLVQNKKLALYFILAEASRNLLLPQRLRLHMTGNAAFWSDASKVAGSSAIALVKLFIPLTLSPPDISLTTTEAGTAVLTLHVPRPSRKQLHDVLLRLQHSHRLVLTVVDPSSGPDPLVQVMFDMAHVVAWLQTDLDINTVRPAQPLLVCDGLTDPPVESRDFRNEAFPRLVLQEGLELGRGLLHLVNLLLILVLTLIPLGRGFVFWRQISRGRLVYAQARRAQTCRRAVRRYLYHLSQGPKSARALVRAKRRLYDIDYLPQPLVKAAQEMDWMPASAPSEWSAQGTIQANHLAYLAECLHEVPYSPEEAAQRANWNFSSMRKLCHSHLVQYAVDLAGLLGLTLLLLWPLRWAWAFHHWSFYCALQGRFEGTRALGLRLLVEFGQDVLALIGSVFVLGSLYQTTPFLVAALDALPVQGLVGWHEVVANHTEQVLTDFSELLGHIFSLDFWKTLILTSVVGFAVVGEAITWCLIFLRWPSSLRAAMAAVVTIGMVIYCFMLPLYWQPNREGTARWAVGAYFLALGVLALCGFFAVNASARHSSTLSHFAQVDRLQGINYNLANLLTVLGLLVEAAQLFVVPWAALVELDSGLAGDTLDVMVKTYEAVTLQFAEALPNLNPQVTFWIAIAGVFITYLLVASPAIRAVLEGHSQPSNLGFGWQLLMSAFLNVLGITATFNVAKVLPCEVLGGALRSSFDHSLPCYGTTHAALVLIALLALSFFVPAMVFFLPEVEARIYNESQQLAFAPWATIAFNVGKLVIVGAVLFLRHEVKAQYAILIVVYVALLVGSTAKSCRANVQLATHPLLLVVRLGIVTLALWSAICALVLVTSTPSSAVGVGLIFGGGLSIVVLFLVIGLVLLHSKAGGAEQRRDRAALRTQLLQLELAAFPYCLQDSWGSKRRGWQFRVNHAQTPQQFADLVQQLPQRPELALLGFEWDLPHCQEYWQQQRLVVALAYAWNLTKHTGTFWEIRAPSPAVDVSALHVPPILRPDDNFTLSLAGMVRTRRRTFLCILGQLQGVAAPILALYDPDNAEAGCQGLVVIDVGTQINLKLRRRWQRDPTVQVQIKALRKSGQTGWSGPLVFEATETPVTAYTVIGSKVNLIADHPPPFPKGLSTASPQYTANAQWFEALHNARGSEAEAVRSHIARSRAQQLGSLQALARGGTSRAAGSAPAYQESASSDPEAVAHESPPMSVPISYDAAVDNLVEQLPIDDPQHPSLLRPLLHDSGLGRILSSEDQPWGVRCVPVAGTDAGVEAASKHLQGYRVLAVLPGFGAHHRAVRPGSYGAPILASPCTRVCCRPDSHPVVDALLRAQAPL
ncbi:uncharacterized protein MONBRDRAFT_9178 [Monosiga brevicollis MX1]|uniref:Uncharacterized protein n=1 Tax=Monosiga brevicollis TaxID=81824 RepID=A9V2B7_MONBE|nr:uncharacterized protein MONBRDRAFT_9178 [Monosiga brevicollis MX1]EDQ88347.1 predicted protein [Monosiga brevicollis MX1]|eukprot:XP_001746940.1 hypothetical protein [Monosiga brevicollis MX1]